MAAHLTRPVRHDQMVELVERILVPSAGSAQALHNELTQCQDAFEQESLQRQIAATDNQIDGLVYELY